MVLSMLVNSLYNIIDSFFVTQISEEAMTALSLVYPVQNFINTVGIGFGVGINAVIAFYLGAGDNRKADQVATQGLVLAVIHGVVMTFCCIAMMPAFLGMFTSSETVIELGVRYSVVAFAFTLIIIVGVTFEKIFQAVGNMKTTMISLMCGCITNIVLDSVLIFGYGLFPAMGIKGAALAEILRNARKEQLKNRMQYGELYHKNYYREVKDKNRVYYEFYHLDGTENVPEDYKKISFVCLRPDGSLELPSTLGIVCRKIAQKLNGFEGFHFHQLRHTYTSNRLANGAAPKDVQELLGHSDVSTTMNVYAHSTRKAKRESARLLDKVAGND